MDPNLIGEAVTAMLNYFWGVAKHLFRMKIIHVILIVLFTVKYNSQSTAGIFVELTKLMKK